MNCCDEYGDCNQGRDCPVRKVKAYPHVPADDMPIQYVTTWRDHFKDLARAMLLVIVVMLASAGAIFLFV